MDELELLPRAYETFSLKHSAGVDKMPHLSSKDALSGVAGGVTSVVLGQPFDLIRVRLQTTSNQGVFSTVKNIFAYEGPLAFYKGATMPLIFVGASVGIQFATFHSVREVLKTQHNSSPSARIAKDYLAGGLAGIANSVISGPVEHIRTRLQAQPHGPARLYAGPLDCIRQIVAKNGLSAVFRAYPVAVTKEFQAYGCYFAAFEASITTLSAWTGRQRKDLSVWETLPCGALAGIAFWVGCFPIDLVKTKLQSDRFGVDARYKSVNAVIQSIWHERGFRGYWRGLSPALVRTSLSSAGCFAMVEQVKKWL